MSRVNEAYRNMLQSAADPSQVGDFVRTSHGRFSNNNTAARIGGTIGTGIGGVAGACAGMGLVVVETVGTFGLLPSFAPEVIAGSVLVPLAALGFAGGVVGATGGYIAQVAVVGALAVVTYVPARVAEASVKGIQSITRRMRMKRQEREQFTAEMTRQQQVLSHSALTATTYGSADFSDHLDACVLDVPAVFSIISNVKDAPVQLLAALFTRNGEYISSIFAGNSELGDAIKYSKTIDNDGCTQATILIEWSLVPDPIDKIVICAVADGTSLKSCYPSFGVLPVVQSQVAELDPSSPATNLSGSGGASAQDVKNHTKLSLTVHDLSSKASRQVDMLYGDKVLLLKEKIAEQAFDIPIESQQLIFGSMMLDNHRTLLECGLFNGATIHVVLDTGGDLASVLEQVEEALPVGFKGKFMTLEECGKCPWFIGAQAIRSESSRATWTLKPESTPVMGRTLDDVLPIIASIVSPPTTIHVEDSYLLEITDVASNFAVEIYAIDRFHMKSLAVSKVSNNGQVIIRFQEFYRIEGLCDAIVVVRVAASSKASDSAERHMTMRVLDNDVISMRFTTRVASQFLAQLHMRNHRVPFSRARNDRGCIITPLRLVCQDEVIDQYLDALYCSFRPASIAVALHKLDISNAKRVEHAGKRNWLIVSLGDSLKRIEFDIEDTTGAIQAAVEWELLVNWRQRQSPITISWMQGTKSTKIASGEFELENFTLPYTGKLELYHREMAMLELSVLLSTTVVPPIAQFPRSQSTNRLGEQQLACPICDEEFIGSQLVVLDPCQHFFCHTCIDGYLESKISEAQVHEMHCPAPSCTSPIAAEMIKELVPQLYERYDSFALDSALSRANAVWCPKPQCGNVMLLRDPDQPMVVCSNRKCNFTYCKQCKRQWHADMNCQQYSELILQQDEVAYERWVLANAKPCPRCNAHIEKNGGCNHMTCKSCSHQFCWLCFGDYTADHFRVGECAGKQFT